jgi:hypothetical protein
VHRSLHRLHRLACYSGRSPCIYSCLAVAVLPSRRSAPVVCTHRQFRDLPWLCALVLAAQRMTTLSTDKCLVRPQCVHLPTPVTLFPAPLRQHSAVCEPAHPVCNLNDDYTSGGMFWSTCVLRKLSAYLPRLSPCRQDAVANRLVTQNAKRSCQDWRYARHHHTASD